MQIAFHKKLTIGEWLLLAVMAFSVLCLTFSYALAADCATDKPCKVLVLTEEQVQTLDQIISNTAIQGPYAQIDQVVKFYKEMLVTAPAGKPRAAPAVDKK